MIDLSRADEDFLTERYKDWLQVASREFRKGFMDGHEPVTARSIQQRICTFQAMPMAMP